MSVFALYGAQTGNGQTRMEVKVTLAQSLRSGSRATTTLPARRSLCNGTQDSAPTTELGTRALMTCEFLTTDLLVGGNNYHFDYK